MASHETGATLCRCYEILNRSWDKEALPPPPPPKESVQDAKRTCVVVCQVRIPSEQERKGRRKDEKGTNEEGRKVV